MERVSRGTRTGTTVGSAFPPGSRLLPTARRRRPTACRSTFSRRHSRFASRRWRQSRIPRQRCTASDSSRIPARACSDCGRCRRRRTLRGSRPSTSRTKCCRPGSCRRRPCRRARTPRLQASRRSARRGSGTSSSQDRPSAGSIRPKRRSAASRRSSRRPSRTHARLAPRTRPPTPPQELFRAEIPFSCFFAY